MSAFFHIARRADWVQAQRDGAYRVSSLGRTLDEEGFIHMSLTGQVAGVAERFYRGVPDLVLLRIDPARLTAPVVTEDLHDTGEAFPHLYGELNPDAVTQVDEFTAPDA
jgi:uncharacterized protein (DUF952 family)